MLATKSIVHRLPFDHKGFQKQRIHRKSYERVAVNAAAPPASNDDTTATSRRQMLFSAPLLTAAAAVVLSSSITMPALAAEGQNTYTDTQDGFSIAVPSGWLQGTGSLGAPPPDARSRFSNAAGLSRVIAWYPENTSDVSVSVTVKTPSADFTGLGSFGTAQDFGEKIVSKIDRSFMLKGAPANQLPVSSARLLNAKEVGGMYYIEYTASNNGEAERTIFTALAMAEAPNGFKRFYTVNGSVLSSDADTYGNTVKQAVYSFKPPSASTSS